MDNIKLQFTFLGRIHRLFGETDKDAIDKFYSKRDKKQTSGDVLIVSHYEVQTYKDRLPTTTLAFNNYIFTGSEWKTIEFNSIDLTDIDTHINQTL